MLIPIVVTWPIGAFYRFVAFDASHFVEEWVKLSITTFIFYFIVEVVQERRRSELSRQDLEAFSRDHIVTPLREAIQQLEIILRTLNPGLSLDVSDQLLTACRHVEHVGSALASANALGTNVKYAGNFERLAPTLIAASVQAVSELAKTRRWGVATIDDLRTVINQLTELLTSLDSSGGKP